VSSRSVAIFGLKSKVVPGSPLPAMARVKRPNGCSNYSKAAKAMKAAKAEGLLWEVPAIAAVLGLIQIGRPLCERCRAHRPGQRRTCPGCHRRVGPGCAAPEGPCWDADAGRCVDCVPVPAGGIRALPA